jgi:hypothetical protein
MAVNPKYVEKVGEEKEQVNYEDILNEFGVEADFVEDASGITVPADYWDRNLKQLPQDEIFAGKPYLGQIETIEWEDKETGEKKTNYQIKLVVIDDASKEAYTIPMNLKNTEVIQENLYPASKLYALQMGLMELKAPGIASQYNRLTVHTDNLREILSKMDLIFFKVILVDGGDFTYKSFRIVSEDEI